MKPGVLVTGGAGYIGSHTVVELVAAGYQPVILDSFVTSSATVLPRLNKLCAQSLKLVEADVRDTRALTETLRAHRISAVIHFAALKSVAESVREPIEYYDTNVGGLINLLKALRESDVRTLVFSSSASVYGSPTQLPIVESAPLQPVSPYAQSKVVCEQMLRDLVASDPTWRIAMLRYFNPVGAHPSGVIGEEPNGRPSNLMPLVTAAAAGLLDAVQIFGSDYPTVDGTGVRDYIHVCDLARGHVLALRHLQDHDESFTLNLGSGRPVSVKQLIATFEEVSGHLVPHTYVDRRPGDVAQCWADPSAARCILGWETAYDLKQMCIDAWRWQKMQTQ